MSDPFASFLLKPKKGAKDDKAAAGVCVCVYICVCAYIYIYKEGRSRYVCMHVCKVDNYIYQESRSRYVSTHVCVCVCVSQA